MLPSSGADEPVFTALRDRWAAFYRLAVPELISPGKLAKIIDPTLTSNSEGSSLERSLRHLAEKGIPRSGRAWQIGQALYGLIPWSSGLVALWLSGNFADFVGLIATLWETVATEDRPEAAFRLLPEISALRFIAAPTVFDAAPFIEDTYCVMEDRCSDEQFRIFQHAMRPTVPEMDEYVYNERARAREQWAMPAEMIKTLETAWSNWRAKPRLETTSEVEFREAWCIAKSPHFSPEERERLIAGCLTSLMNRQILRGIA